MLDTAEINTNTFFMVVHKEFGVYTESPAEQGVAEGPFLVRVFASEPEAQRYLEAVAEYAGGDLAVVHTSLQKLWGMKIQVQHRIELCAMPEREHARRLDLIWDPSATWH